MTDFIQLLQKDCNYTLDYWNPDKFNWEKHSLYLAKYCSEHFNKWWDSEKYNWKESSDILAHFCAEYFNKWWDSEKFNWQEDSWTLAKYCSVHFSKWWDPDKYNWENNSWTLAKYCSVHFSKWWDPDKYNWEKDSDVLARYCSDLFDKWWNPDKYNWEKNSWTLAKYCSEHFNKWWNSEKYNWKRCSWLLPWKCMDYIEKWWDSKKFNWEVNQKDLKSDFPKNGMEYVNIWIGEFVKHFPDHSISQLVYDLKPEILEKYKLNIFRIEMEKIMMDCCIQILCFKLNNLPAKNNIENLSLKDVKEIIEKNNSLKTQIEQYNLNISERFQEFKDKITNFLEYFSNKTQNPNYIIITSERCCSIIDDMFFQIFLELLKVKFNAEVVAEHTLETF